MKELIKNWKIFLKEGKDTKKVAKIILFDEDDKVLFLKRTKYTKKFSGEWDIPGGHVQENESIEDGLEREVFEETGLKIKNYKKFKVVKNMHYFKGKLPKGEIKLSNEHSESKLRKVKSRKNPSKFEKIAQEMLNDE